MVGLGLALLAFAAAAGLSRYRTDGSGHLSFVVRLETEPSGFRLVLPGDPGPPGFPLHLDPGYYAVESDHVVFAGPLAWIRFPEALRPAAVLWGRERADLARPGMVKTLVIAPRGRFERVLAGPASRIGLWSYDIVRTSWEPTRSGARSWHFASGGFAGETLGEEPAHRRSSPPGAGGR